MEGTSLPKTNLFTSWNQQVNLLPPTVPLSSCSCCPQTPPPPPPVPSHYCHITAEPSTFPNIGQRKHCSQKTASIPAVGGQRGYNLCSRPALQMQQNTVHGHRIIQVGGDRRRFLVQTTAVTCHHRHYWFCPCYVVRSNFAKDRGAIIFTVPSSSQPCIWTTTLLGFTSCFPGYVPFS